MPRNFIPAVEEGLREYMVKGPLAGFPVVDFRAELYFGSYHDVDSSEMSFKLATRLSSKKGTRAGRGGMVSVMRRPPLRRAGSAMITSAPLTTGRRASA